MLNFAAIFINYINLKRKMRTRKLLSIAIMLSALPTGVWATDYVPKIVAGVVKADSWTMENAAAGVYQLEVKEEPTLTQLSQGNDVMAAPLGGAVYADGEMHGIHFLTEPDPYTGGTSYTIYHVTYDMQDWTRTKTVAMDNLYANLISSCGIAHDPVSGLNYGIFYNFNMDMQVINRKLAAIDFSTDKPTKTNVDVVDTPFAAIAFAANGFLYGVGQDGYLYIIDTTDASPYQLGDLGLEDISTYPASMTFDPRTEKLYFSYVTTGMKSQLYEISYAIGSVKATKVMDVPDNAFLVNMHIAPTIEGAPMAATNLQLTFEGERTTGMVSFTMPTTTQDAEPLEGELTYTIAANGTEIAEGQADAGEEVSTEVTVPQSGDTEISVVIKNDKGESTAVKTTQYIGRDIPKAVGDLHLAYNTTTGKAELSWTAPTEGQHGKTLTEANLTYNVVRQPGDVVVATATKETSFREELSNEGELTAYRYEVTPLNGDLEGETATSNTIVLGDALEVPFTEDFYKEEGFNRFTTIDTNNDGFNSYGTIKGMWTHFYKYYQYSGSTVYGASITAGSQADDDWLISPAIRVEKDNRYELSFEANKSYAASNYDQKMEVYMGIGDDVTTYELLATCDIDDVNMKKFSNEWTPSADGLYRIAFHAISNANSDRLLLTNVKFDMLVAGNAPQAPTDMTITPNEKGLLTATVALTAPMKSVSGDDLSEITKVEVQNADGQVVGTTENVTPGEPCTIECSNLKNGYNTLTAYAYVGENRGEKVSAEAFIGVDRPAAPTDVRLCDDGEQAYLTWEAPTEGYYGHYINPEALTYNLFTIAEDGYADLFKENISKPYPTGDATNEGDQHLLYYAMNAQSAAGEGPIVATNSLVVGEAYPLPFQESFDAGFHSSQFIWFAGNMEDISRNFKLSDNAADDDDAALAFYPNYSSTGIFNTGKVSLEGAIAPVFSFSYYALPEENMTLIVSIDRMPQGEWQQVAAIDFNKETEEGWREVQVPLTDFMDYPYIVLRFEMTSLSDNFSPVIIDNIRVADPQPTAITHLSTPNTQHPTAIYDLQGRRLGSCPGKGVYIIDGHKVVKK